MEEEVWGTREYELQASSSIAVSSALVHTSEKILFHQVSTAFTKHISKLQALTSLGPYPISTDGTLLLIITVLLNSQLQQSFSSFSFFFLRRGFLLCGKSF